jgi:hypothetical protein
MLATALAPAQAQTPPAPAQLSYFGMELRSLSREEVQSPGVPGAGGAEITKVEAGASAAAAGEAAAENRPKVQIVPQLGHSDQVWSVAFAPDGKTALSGSHDNTLRLWDLATGREIKKFEGHLDLVSSVAIAPDGKTALLDSWDHSLRLWDLASGREIRKFEGHSRVVNSVAFAPDGQTACASRTAVFACAGENHASELSQFRTGRPVRSTTSALAEPCPQGDMHKKPRGTAGYQGFSSSS